MTDKELMEMKDRAEKIMSDVENNPLEAEYLAEYDVPELIAEVERLNEDNERLTVALKLAQTARVDALNDYGTVITILSERTQEVTRLRAELDAAKKDFTDYVHGGHEKCAYCEHDDECEPGESLCYGNVNGWEWRGN